MRGELVSRGLHWNAVCNAARIETSSMDQPDGVILGRDELRLQKTVAEATVDDAKAWFELGSRYRATAYGTFSLAVLSAKDAGEAVRTITSFQDLTYSLLTYYALEDAGGAIRGMSVDDSGVPDHLKAFYLIRDLGGMRRALNDWVLDEFPLERVSVSVPEPAGWEEFGRDFGCPVEFGASQTIWHFRKGAENRTLPLADSLLAEAYTLQCAEEVNRSRKGGDVDAVLMGIFLNSGQHFPSAGEAARQIGVSKRSLHARLSKLNTSFGAVLDRARQQRAHQLLSQTQMPIRLISRSLGFAETASFARAFKRWTGTPPAQFRSQMQDEGEQSLIV
ncbi:MAG TPA: AraC family transcriptional regulator ligand-binding domain-containing protein [Sphingopyxis sp.]|nr:AraC family transcriptional regulator ligand-binding domain-containing protein [Sphingopyxis sp.]